MKKKIVSLMVLTLVLLLSLATNVYAADLFGTVRVISAGESDIENNTSKTVTVKYNAGNLKWYEKDLQIGRNVDGYWIGIRIDAPSWRAENAKYKRGGVEVSFDKVKDGTDYVNAWINVTSANLQAIKEKGEPYVILEYEFDWNGDGDFNDQKLIVQVDPDKIVLEDVPETHAKVTVNSIVGSKVFTVKKGESLNEYLTDSEKAVLKQLQEAPKGKKLVGIFKGDKAFSLDEKITENTILTIKFADALDETPKTGVNDSMLASLVVMNLSLLGMLTLKKKYN